MLQATMILKPLPANIFAYKRRQ